jgi:hypothetical protein
MSSDPTKEANEAAEDNNQEDKKTAGLSVAQKKKLKAKAKAEAEAKPDGKEEVKEEAKEKAGAAKGAKGKKGGAPPNKIALLAQQRV